MAGLQLICATASAFIDRRHVFRPRRAAAIAASVPACPAPTTTTSNRYSSALTSPSFHREFASLFMIAASKGRAGGARFETHEPAVRVLWPNVFPAGPVSVMLK